MLLHKELALVGLQKGIPPLMQIDANEYKGNKSMYAADLGWSSSEVADPSQFLLDRDPCCQSSAAAAMACLLFLLPVDRSPDRKEIA